MTITAPGPRVLHLIPSLGEGGAERQLSYLGAELVRRGWSVDVALLRGGPNLERLARGGATVHVLAYRNHHDPALLWRLHRLARKVRPDVVHTWLTQMDVLGGAVALANRIPWVLAERSDKVGYPPTTKNLLRVGLGRHADAIVSNSKGGESYWEERSGRRTLRLVVPNAVTAEGKTEDSGVLGEVTAFLAGKGLALFVGRLSKEKDPVTFLRALTVGSVKSSVKGVICGDGPLRDELERMVPELGLTGRILLLGNVASVWPLLKRADLLVSTSLFEGEPNAVLEAMACGCPLVVSDIPAHRELLGGDALYAAPGEPEQFACAMEQLLAGPDGARQRADRARERVAKRSVAAMACRYERIYRSLLGGRPRS